MTADRFAELLAELGVELGISLHPDKRGACRLRIDETYHVQLECDGSQENLIVFSFLCELPPGKFRENILKDALKANTPYPLHGALSYSERNNQLALHASLRLSQLNGKLLADFLVAFMEKAKQWRQAVETGNTSQLVTQIKSAGIFDLK
jgi:hypothetical protein